MVLRLYDEVGSSKDHAFTSPCTRPAKSVQVSSSLGGSVRGGPGRPSRQRGPSALAAPMMAIASKSICKTGGEWSAAPGCTSWPDGADTRLPATYLAVFPAGRRADGAQEHGLKCRHREFFSWKRTFVSLCRSSFERGKVRRVGA